MLMREHTPIELIGGAAKFEQKAMESIQARLVWLRDVGGGAEKISNITTHPALQQLLQGAQGFKILIPL